VTGSLEAFEQSVLYTDVAFSICNCGEKVLFKNVVSMFTYKYTKKTQQNPKSKQKTKQTNKKQQKKKHQKNPKHITIHIVQPPFSNSY
jgi:hypothetical protein